MSLRSHPKLQMKMIKKKNYESKGMENKKKDNIVTVSGS